MPQTGSRGAVIRTGHWKIAACLALATVMSIVAVSAKSEDFGAIVVRATAGSGDDFDILVSDNIDATTRPDLIGRFFIIALGLDDVASGELDRSDRLRVGRSGRADPVTALQAIALGRDGYRIPMAAVASRIGTDDVGLKARIDGLQSRVGMRGSDIDVRRAADGGVALSGYTTLRDTARLVVALSAGLSGDLSDIFAPIVGDAPPDVWMIEDGTCLAMMTGPRTSEPLVSVLRGAPDAETCYTASLDLIRKQDERLASAGPR